MAPNDKAGRVVFIGNIPYGQYYLNRVPHGGTEELIIETLERVGKVINFRLVYDKETGRPKGFGFAEFEDADAAASAVRNLNDYELMNRKLRVDWSNDNGAGDNAPSGHNPQSSINGQMAAPAAAPVALPPIPPGAEIPPNLTAPDAISRTLSTLPTPQLLDILSQMKGLVMSDPAKATELLRQAPQLAYAIFQSLLLLGLVDPQVIGGLVEAPAVAPAPPPQAPTPLQAPPQARPPQTYAAYPPAPVPTPPQPYVQQPPPQQPPQAPQGVDPQHQAIYAQILSMTQQQIDSLAPEPRAQILQLRQALRSAQR